jgi:hypothetical protein
MRAITGASPALPGNGRHGVTGARHYFHGLSGQWQGEDPLPESCDLRQPECQRSQ